MADKFVGLNESQCQRIERAVIWTESQTVGRSQGGSTYRPGLTQICHGKLTATVTSDSSASPSSQKGTFQPWSAGFDPSDSTSVEAANADISSWDIWPWGMADKTSLPSGTPLFAGYAGGRWYTILVGLQIIGGTTAASLSSMGTISCNVSYGSTASTRTVVDVDGAFGTYPIASGKKYKAYWNVLTQQWEFMWIAC